MDITALIAGTTIVTQVDTAIMFALGITLTIFGFFTVKRVLSGRA